MLTNKNLSKALKLLRAYHRVPLVQISIPMGVCHSHLSELENDRRSVTLNGLEIYSTFFKIRVSTLVYFAEELSKLPGDAPEVDRMKVFVEACERYEPKA